MACSGLVWYGWVGSGTVGWSKAGEVRHDTFSLGLARSGLASFGRNGTERRGQLGSAQVCFGAMKIRFGLPRLGLAWLG